MADLVLPSTPSMRISVTHVQANQSTIASPHPRMAGDDRRASNNHSAQTENTAGTPNISMPIGPTDLSQHSPATKAPATLAPKANSRSRTAMLRLVNHHVQKKSVRAALVPTAAKKLTKIRASSQPGTHETIQ